MASISKLWNLTFAVVDPFSILAEALDRPPLERSNPRPCLVVEALDLENACRDVLIGFLVLIVVSFLYSFCSTYPSWEPNAYGQQFVSTLCKFREWKLHQELHQYLPTRTWQPGTRYPSWDLHHASRGLRLTGFDLDPLCSLIPDQRAHPYLLDWYYTSQPSPPLEIVTESPRLPNHATFERTQDMWSPQHKPQTETEDDEDWGSHLPDRLRSHFEASTSNDILRNDIHQHLNSEQHSVNRWWARPGPQTSDPQASFIEPPAFGHCNFGHHSDDVSDRSVDYQEGGGDDTRKDPLMLSRTTYMENPDYNDAINLDFVDEPGREGGSGYTFANTLGDPSTSFSVKILPSGNDPVP